ncbi:MAG TPA: DegV family protein [Chloroflexota bacterium]|nr:DegV family protein [Chloroflexota bacterium]
MSAASRSAAWLGSEAAPRVAVVCESTACLPAALRDELGIAVIPVPFAYGDHTFLDGVDITPAEFYARLVATRTPPRTSPPAPGDYLRVWERASVGGRPVIAVTVADALSTFGRSVRLAADLAASELPGVPITVIDSGSAGMGQGFVALAAARAAAARQPLASVVESATRVRNSVRLLVTLDTLEYLARASRIPRIASVLGGILAIKPIIELSGGEARPLARLRTRRRALADLRERLRRSVPEGARLHAGVQHAQAAEEAVGLEEWLGATFDCAELLTTEFTPVMGGYCGPGLLGVAYYVEDVLDGG